VNDSTGWSKGLTVTSGGDAVISHAGAGRSDLPPVGVFAGRGPRRPNRIGVTCCAIESVHGRELTVVISSADDSAMTRGWTYAPPPSSGGRRAGLRSVRATDDRSTP
jgi:hypothetical protein